MKRPLLSVALAYVGGVLVGDFFHAPLGLLFAFSLLLVAVSIGQRRLRPWLLWLLLPLAGWTNMLLRTVVLSPHDLRLAVGDRIEYVTLRGTLLETPEQRVFEHEEKETWRSLAKVQVAELRRGANSEPAFGKVAVSTPGILGGDFCRGQTVEVAGVIGSPRGPLAEGLFDYRAYLRRQGIYHQLQAETITDWQVVRAVTARIRPPLGDRFRAWAQQTIARGLSPPDESLRLLWAMALGWKTALTDEVAEPFMRSGTMHIFAISGLHIALIAGILVKLLRVLRVPRAGCGLLTVPLIWFYTAATGWQSSAIRSTIMMSIVIGGWALRRPMDLLNSLAGAAFIILLWDPQQLFQASFQLSFFVVLSIALLLPPLEKYRRRLLQPDPLLPLELRPRWQRWLDLPVRFVTTSLATSLAAWLGSLPLVAYYFHLFTPVSLGANLVIVPLSALALMSCLGSLLCGSWFPALSELFNHSGWFWMHCMVGASDWCVSLPGAYLYLRSPNWLGFAAYYPLLFGTLTGWLWAPKRRRWIPAGLAAFGGVWLISWWPHRSDFRLTVLSLRGGDTLFVDGPRWANDLLIDCGDLDASNLLVKPFLRGQGVNRLPALMLTHGDLLHVGGAETIISEFKTRVVLTSDTPSRSATYRRILENLNRSPGHQRRLVRGDRVGHWTVLHPAAGDQFAQADDNAIVLRGEFQSARVLCCSDLGRLGQRTMLNREGDLRADILIAGMPNAGEPLGSPLLDAVQPRAIVLSAGRYPTSERASAQLRERLGKRGLPVFLTSEVGAVTVTIRPKGWAIRTMKGEGYPVAASQLSKPDPQD